MQSCSMNGDHIRRDKDGTLYLNGRKIIKYRVDVTDKLLYVLIGMIIGMSTCLGVFYLCGVSV